MRDTYIYPAVLNYATDGISVHFPDLPGCLTCADSTAEAAKNAKEALGLHLWSMEKDGDLIPEATELSNLVIGQVDIPLLVEVFMPPVRDRINNRFVKKTLSIPFWLNAEAERAGVNFSQILQQSLKNYLRL